MDFSAIESRTRRPSTGVRSLIEKVGFVFARLNAPLWKLDLDAMPDQLKRDLGFLDGREPRYEDHRRR